MSYVSRSHLALYTMLYNNSVKNRINKINRINKETKPFDAVMKVCNVLLLTYLFLLTEKRGHIYP